MSLDYIPQSPVAPGTMPAGVPGFGQAPGVWPGPPASSGQDFSAPGLMPPGAGPDASQYEAVTQADGSILLHLKNSDGSLGPAVRIINPIKPKAA